MEVELLIGRHIKLRVFPVTSQVIIELLNHGDREHYDKRHDKRDQEADTECWNDLGEGNQQEEQIEEVLELIIQ